MMDKLKEAVEAWKRSRVVPSNQASIMTKWRYLEEEYGDTLIDLAQKVIEGKLVDGDIHAKVVAEKDEEIKHYKDFIGDEAFQSDYQRVSDMRMEIDRLKKIVDGITVENVKRVISLKLANIEMRNKEIGNKNFMAGRNIEEPVNVSQDLAEAIVKNQKGEWPMPDIAMCKDDKCPKRKTCYRFIATPTPDWQCYFTEIVRKEDKCEYYWEVLSNSVRKRLDAQIKESDQ